jgi:hypothetical protein
VSAAATIYTRADVRRWLELLGLKAAALPRAGRALIVDAPGLGAWTVRKAGAGYAVAALEPIRPALEALEAGDQSCPACGAVQDCRPDCDNRGARMDGRPALEDPRRI